MNKELLLHLENLKQKDIRTRKKLILLPAAWVVGEWLSGFILTGFAWMMLGYSQLDTPLGGYAAVTGVLGVGWAVAVVAGVIALLIHDRSTCRTAVPMAKQ